MERSPSSLFRLLWYLKVHYRVQKGPQFFMLILVPRPRREFDKQQPLSVLGRSGVEGGQSRVQWGLSHEDAGRIGRSIYFECISCVRESRRAELSHRNRDNYMLNRNDLPDFVGSSNSS